MRRGNGFVRLFLGMILALVLVLGVCGGVGAEGHPKSELELLREEVNTLRHKLDDVRERQMLSDGRAWYERAKLQLDHVKEWVNEERVSSEKWYSNLSLLSVFLGAWITVFGIGVTLYGFFNTKQQRLDAEKAKAKFDKEIQKLKDDIKERKSSLDTEQNELYKKEQQLTVEIEENKERMEELLSKCREHAKECAIHNKNAQNDSFAIKKFREDRVDNANRSKEQSQALDEVSKDEKASTYDRLRATALKYQDKQEWRKALTTWETAGEMFPQKDEPFFAQGYILQEEIVPRDSSHKEELLTKAEENYHRATTINPNEAGAWNNWANILKKKAQRATGKLRIDLRNKAKEKYLKATTSRPDYSTAWTNWANLIYNEAKDATDPNKASLYDKAEEYCGIAAGLDTKNAIVWANWSTILVNRTKDLLEEQSETILKEAKEKALRAESISKGYGAYNLACIAALQNDFEDCKRWLLNARLTDPDGLTSAELQSDPDLENIRNHPEHEKWFEDFVNQVCQEEQEAAAKQDESEKDDTDTEE